MNETIIENPMQSITFNFFTKSDCSQFRFCHSYKVKTDFLYELLSLSPEERLTRIQPFLDKGPKGKSCELYFNGEFIQCGIVTEKKEGQKNRAKGLKKK